MRDELIQQINEYMGCPKEFVFFGTRMDDTDIRLIHMMVKAAYLNGNSEGMRVAKEIIANKMDEYINHKNVDFSGCTEQ